MSDPAQRVTVTGPSVATGLRFTPPGHARFRFVGAHNTADLDPGTIAGLFAFGLRTPEPDRNGWVTVGEVDVDDQIQFLIGTTGIDRDTAMHAICRGVERALLEGLTHRRYPSPDVPESQDSP